MSGARDALAPIRDTIVDSAFRGFPGDGVRLDEIGTRGWSALRPPMTLPLLLLKRGVLEDNLVEMSRYCERHGVRLAPHGKTHMSPQLWQLQEQHGAWAVTVADARQAEVYRTFGARRILLANELIAEADLAWLTRVRAEDPGLELLLVVDSSAGVGRLAGAVPGTNAPQPVLIELGHRGARAGARDLDEVVELAREIAASPGLRLVGVEGFEGAVPGSGDEDGSQLASVRHYLDDARGAVLELHSLGLLSDEVIVTFGGSKFFDAVTELLVPDWPADLEVVVVLRSGCYLTLDHGIYAAAFERPGLFRPGHRPELMPALELWATVLSCPEPDLAIVGFGRRDAPYDAGLPIPLLRRRAGESASLRGRARVEQLNDQHAFVRIAHGELAVGDLVSFGISHPCTAFDKWRLVPVVDDDYTVVDAVRTYF